MISWSRYQNTHTRNISMINSCRTIHWYYFMQVLNLFSFISDVLGPPTFRVISWLCLKGGVGWACRKIQIFFSNIGVVSGRNLFIISILTTDLTYCTISIYHLRKNRISHKCAQIYITSMIYIFVILQGSCGLNLCNIYSIWNELVCLESVNYSIYVSLYSNNTCEPCFKEFCDHVWFISLVESVLLICRNY